MMKLRLACVAGVILTLIAPSPASPKHRFVTAHLQDWTRLKDTIR
jgi:hypothetical protein